MWFRGLWWHIFRGLLFLRLKKCKILKTIGIYLEKGILYASK
jgi:hypothetical protein